MSINPSYIFSCFILFVLCACNGPDKIEFTWTEIEVPTTDRLEGVYFLNDSVGHLVGGIPYQSGIHLVTYDGGRSWNSTFFSNTVYDFSPMDNGQLVQAAFSGLRRKVNREENWFIQGIPDFNFSLPPLNAVSVRPDGHLLIGGGIAFEKGVIFQLDENFQSVTLDTFPAEISDVAYLSSTRAVAVGYGIVLESDDGGSSWTRLPVYNDFFQSVSFPTPEIGYMIGFSGSILKSEDSGLSWSIKRDGNRLSVSNEPFRSVFFKDEFLGFIVGNGGLFWMTTDGGDSWKKITNLPDRNFYDVFVQNEKIYIVGDEGTLIQMAIP